MKLNEIKNNNSINSCIDQLSLLITQVENNVSFPKSNLIDTEKLKEQVSNVIECFRLSNFDDLTRQEHFELVNLFGALFNYRILKSKHSDYLDKLREYVLTEGFFKLYSLSNIRTLSVGNPYFIEGLVSQILALLRRVEDSKFKRFKNQIENKLKEIVKYIFTDKSSLAKIRDISVHVSESSLKSLEYKLFLDFVSKNITDKDIQEHVAEFIARRISTTIEHFFVHEVIDVLDVHGILTKDNNNDIIINLKFLTEEFLEHVLQKYIPFRHPLINNKIKNIVNKQLDRLKELYIKHINNFKQGSVISDFFTDKDIEEFKQQVNDRIIQLKQKVEKYFRY